MNTNKEHAIAGQKVFDIGMGALIICLSDAISLDVVKTNAVQILKQAGIVDVRSL